MIVLAQSCKKGEAIGKEEFGAFSFAAVGFLKEVARTVSTQIVGSETKSLEAPRIHTL